jgi:hypothetical protein
LYHPPGVKKPSSEERLLDFAEQTLVKTKNKNKTN